MRDTLEHLENELARYRELYEQADRDGNASGKEGARQKIAEIEQQILRLKQEQEHEERIQKQSEHIDGLLEAVSQSGLFEAIDPQPENGERLHEYEERKKEFNLILYDFVKEQIEVVNRTHNEEISKKDERIQELLKKMAEMQKEIDIANARINDLENQADEYHQEMLKYMQDSQEKDKVIAQKNADIERKDWEIRSLQERIQQLEQTQKPTEYAKPSESLAERVNSLKEKSMKAKAGGLNKTLEERLASFYERNKNVLQVPDFVKKEEKPDGESFRAEGENNSSVEFGNDRLYSSEEVTFRISSDSTSPGFSEKTTGNDSGMGFEAWAKAEIEALKKRVDHLYQVSGHSDPAA